MPASILRKFPPYQGSEPYLYLCFHPDDIQQIKPILDEMTNRRCRVWYRVRNAAKLAEKKRQIKLEKDAHLMVFWLSARAAASEDMKSALGYYLTTGQPVICINTQPSAMQNGFSLILNHTVEIINDTMGLSPEALVSLLMRTAGFTQQLIAESDRERQLFLQKQKSRRLALRILFATMIFLGCATVYAKSNNWFLPQPVIADSVTISDPVIERAARHALSPEEDMPLTQENLASIKTLRIDAPPSSFDELALFPALTQLEIPQSCVNQAVALLDGAPYRIVVYSEAVS